MDYNLEMNEAESETDKQAALVDNQSNFNGKWCIFRSEGHSSQRYSRIP